MSRDDEIDLNSLPPGDDHPDPQDPQQTLVPDGEYRVAYVSSGDGIAYGRKVFFVRFKIVEPVKFADRLLLRFVNVPKQWLGKRTHQKARSLARTSTLWLDYVAITERVPPARVFGPAALYKDSLLRAKVVTVKEQNVNGKRIKMPECAWYSKIETIICQEAGPHALRR